MKETIATIPLMNAFHADDECPFCYLEREAEQHAISFILGSAYMEDDIRAKTDATGFCRHHFKMMYDYGNRLGNALILSTHLKKLNQELDDELAHFTPGKSSFIKRMKHTDVSSGNAPKTPLGAWIAAKTTDCYVCDHFHQIYGRYLDTFFDLYKKNEEFRALFEKSRGFCLPHFGDLIEAAEDKLTDDENLEKLFPKKSPVYTKIRDDNPTRYVPGCKVTDSILADGCVIEGTVENCVLFRGVKVKKGAVVKNCVLMQDTVVEPGAELDCVVTDKNVRITAEKKLSGTKSFPVYVQKNHIV